MTERAKVATALLGRNKLDVAMELTRLYYGERLVGDIKEIQDVFTKFYAVVDLVGRLDADDLAQLVPKDLAKLWQIRR
ncbi:MAG: hypothetical protein GX060_04015 [Firmicutes bacterium]|nr:hypothetical protein [Bacillota bacterium]